MLTLGRCEGKGGTHRTVADPLEVEGAGTGGRAKVQRRCCALSIERVESLGLVVGLDVGGREKEDPRRTPKF